MDENNDNKDGNSFSVPNRSDEELKQMIKGKDMDKLTAQQAYDKTTALLQAYSDGDCLGGNPMCHIEEYAKQQTEELQKEIKRLNEHVPMAVYDKLQKKADELADELESSLMKHLPDRCVNGYTDSKFCESKNMCIDCINTNL